MTMWKVEVAINGRETVTAKCHTLREACDMVFMCRASMEWEPNDARLDAASIERTLKGDVRNTIRMALSRSGCYCVSVEKVAV